MRPAADFLCLTGPASLDDAPIRIVTCGTQDQFLVSDQALRGGYLLGR